MPLRRQGPGRHGAEAGAGSAGGGGAAAPGPLLGQGPPPHYTLKPRTAVATPSGNVPYEHPQWHCYELVIQKGREVPREVVVVVRGVPARVGDVDRVRCRLRNRTESGHF
eukprot:scaffold7976_cov105-Isochrysis_galbana.AAC.5